MTQDVADALDQPSPRAHLTKLVLSGVDIGDAGAEAIGQLLMGNNVLQHLVLHRNRGVCRLRVQTSVSKMRPETCLGTAWGVA